MTLAEKDGEPWYVTAFRSDYRRVYPHRDLESARQEVGGLLELGLSGRVLDLACGFGRHSVAMLERGLDVFGFDLSFDLLTQAESPVRERIARGDARRIPFRTASFDSVAVLFSSFGYFGDPGDGEVAAEIARVLRPGGLCVLDLMNPTRVQASLIAHTRTRQDDYILEEERSLEDEGRRVVKRVKLTGPEGERTWREDVRLYEPEEIEALLSEHGLRVERTAGDFDGSPAGPSAVRQIVLSRRQA
jgi:SAM-dependent methyltransferase